jgi:hypothetical protein
LEDSLSPDRREGGERPPALEDLVLLAAEAGNDRRVGRTSSGRLVSVRPVPSVVKEGTTAAVVREIVERLRTRCAGPHLVPLAGAVQQEGTLWIATEVDRGVSLRRLLAVVSLTPVQACYLVQEILAGLAELHRLGLCHTRLHHGNVHVDVAGKVRLTDWALSGISGEEASPTCRRTDLQSVAVLVRRLARAAGDGARGRHPAATHALEQLQDLVAEERDDVEALVEEARRSGAFLPDTGTRAAAAQLGELSAALGGNAPESPLRAARRPQRSAFRAPGPWIKARSAGSLRPRPRRRMSAIAVCVLVLVVLAGLAAWQSGLANQVRRPQTPSLSLPHAPSPAPTPRPAPSGERRPVPTPTAGLRPVPSLGPPAAGAVSGVDLQPLQPRCAAGSSCPVRVTVRLAPQPQAQIVAWTFDLFDRCTGGHLTASGGSVTALSEWPYVYETTWLQTPAGHPLAAVAVSSSPARVASQPLPLDGTRSC